MKTVLITGGSEGLGYSIAKRLSNSCKVVILSPDKDRLEEVSEELKCSYKVCDVSGWGQVNSTVAEISSENESLDVLINNAGVYAVGELDETPADKIKRVIEVNSLGPIYMSKAVIPFMKKQQSGKIINIISQSGLYHAPQKSVYRASKWALTGFTKCLQPELSKYGISVTGIYPGLMKTSFVRNEDKERSLDDALDPDEVSKTIEFVMLADGKIVFPEIGIKNLDNTY
ncbi:hypothetical protein A2982_02920 [candidate division WWE3 bacterium RIFCSPLOWO2_01_FULL_39_13]|uniref:Short-chain dehydrogenase n=1 Tax=candidate division WWE3 bacterium RIFCSPLOWO2_01_FULL_39_13 TaxID=1802624 RepID=A0A1F4V2V8_UNCKA|nr:MAG: hypothetical protein A2982_02920 [candidate division WWE3 bacterium RIFCSPLOWO2_01_FULL_39_13]